MAASATQASSFVLPGAAMSVDADGVMLLGFALQALAAIGLALLLGRFHRIYRHGYQRLWAWSWTAFSVYLVGTAVAVLAARVLRAGDPGGLVGERMLLVAGYWQIVWLLMGLGMVLWLLEDERQRAVSVGEKIQTLAYRDPVTGLPNRNLFLDQLRRALAQARRGGESVAVLFLDLDRFKAVNDTWGHAVGDQVLRAAGRRLQAELREEGFLARFGGDEFAVLLPGVRHPGEVAAACRRLLVSVSRPLAVAGQEVFTAVSIGASLYPQHGDDPETLLKRADIAMYEAKAQGRDRFEFYDAVLGARAQETSLESDLRRALQAGEFVLFYQPVVELASGRAIGVEALLRWDHPTRGLVGPESFLPAAEASGLVDRLDGLALRTAAEQAVLWRKQGMPIAVAINISAGQLHRFGIVHQVQEVLAATGLPASSLSIEITETAAMRDAGATQVVLNSLRDLGVGIAMDDFGTGYSSLAHMQSFPIDQLKIDASFVRGLGRQPQSATITSAVIGLAHGLGLTVVAEGIETEQQMMMLRGFGCDRGQGYLFGRPVRAEEIVALFSSAADALAVAPDS